MNAACGACELGAPQQRHIRQQLSDRGEVAHLWCRQRNHVRARATTVIDTARPALLPAAAKHVRRLPGRFIRGATLERADLLPELRAAVGLLEAQRVVEARLGLVPREDGVLLPRVRLAHAHARLDQVRPVVLVHQHDEHPAPEEEQVALDNVVEVAA